MPTGNPLDQLRRRKQSHATPAAFAAFSTAPRQDSAALCAACSRSSIDWNFIGVSGGAAKNAVTFAPSAFASSPIEAPSRSSGAEVPSS